MNNPSHQQEHPAPTQSGRENLMQEFLASTRSPNTRRAYEKDLNYFFRFLSESDPIPELINQFLGLSRAEAVKIVLHYKSRLLAAELKSATINRRIAPVKAFVAFAYRLEKCTFSLEQINGEEIVPYRDVTGVTVEQFRQILNTPDRTTDKGKRDYALLLLMWSNALRRNEVRTKVKDFDAENGTLTIMGKGRTEPEKVDLSPVTVEAIKDWLQCRPNLSASAPLFIALDRAHYGLPLTASGVYTIVNAIAKQAGIDKVFSPNRVKHSSITAMLDEIKDIRDVLKITRHRQADNMLIYDDRPANEDTQKELSDLASMLIQD